MSGGRYEYKYHYIHDLADEIEASNPERVQFIEHLRMVAKACQAIEWVDSFDYGPGDELGPIRACIGVTEDRDMLDIIESDRLTVAATESGDFAVAGGELEWHVRWRGATPREAMREYMRGTN